MNYKQANIGKVFYQDNISVASMANSIKLSSVEIILYFHSSFLTK